LMPAKYVRPSSKGQKNDLRDAEAIAEAVQAGGLEGRVTVYYMGHMSGFGRHVRKIREGQAEGDPRFSLRQVAQRVGVEPAYLSKVERDEVSPPSEATIGRLAKDLGEDRDVLLALAGKVSTDLQEVIRRRPKLFAELLRELKRVPDDAVLRIVREV